MKRLLQFLIKAYFYAISPWLGPNCRFYPTCSSYTHEAIEKHGALKGLVLGIVRILKCQPLCKHHGHDPVPEAFDWADVIGYKRKSQSKNDNKEEKHQGVS